MTPGSDQLFSLFARWVLPVYGVESYIEWGRADFPISVRDMLEQPDHSRAYTAGLQWAKALGPDSKLRVQGEATNEEQPDAPGEEQPGDDAGSGIAALWEEPRGGQRDQRPCDARRSDRPFHAARLRSGPRSVASARRASFAASWSDGNRQSCSRRRARADEDRAARGREGVLAAARADQRRGRAQGRGRQRRDRGDADRYRHRARNQRHRTAARSRRVRPCSPPRSAGRLRSTAFSGCRRSPSARAAEKMSRAPKGGASVVAAPSSAARRAAKADTAPAQGSTSCSSPPTATWSPRRWTSVPS